MYLTFCSHPPCDFVFHLILLQDLGLSNLSITEGAKSSAAVPQTRAPAVTRRSTFHTSGKDDEEEQGSGVLDVDRPSEISAQEKYVLQSLIFSPIADIHLSFDSCPHPFNCFHYFQDVIYALIPSIMMHNV